MSNNNVGLSTNNYAAYNQQWGDDDSGVGGQDGNVSGVNTDSDVEVNYHPYNPVYGSNTNAYQGAYQGTYQGSYQGSQNQGNWQGNGGYQSGNPSGNQWQGGGTYQPINNSTGNWDLFPVYPTPDDPYIVGGNGTPDDVIEDQPEDTREVYNRETTETNLTTQEFSHQEVENGKAFLERMAGLAENGIDENDASHFFLRNDDGSIDTSDLGQLGRIVGSPDANTGEYSADQARAGEVFISGVLPGQDLIGTAGSGADRHLAMELRNGNIDADDFIELANDTAFLSRNESARADYIREFYTDQGVDNIANGREPTNGEDNIYTSRDGLLFKVPDAAGDPDTGPVEPYFVRADGTPIPSTLQGIADTEGLAGGMSQRVEDGIAVLGGTMELSPEQQATADGIVAEYLGESGNTELDQNEVTERFLGRVQTEILGDQAYRNGSVENTMPETATPFISEGWRNTLFHEVVNGPEGLLANSQYIEGDTVTDRDGLWGEIQERVYSPQAQQFVYESITGSLYDTSTATVPLPPVNVGGETISSEQREFLDLVAEDGVHQLGARDDLDEAGLSDKLQQSVAEGHLTQAEADYVEGKMDELQFIGPQPPFERAGSWEQGATPWLSAEQKAGYAGDIERLRQIDPAQTGYGDNSWRVDIDAAFPDASPQVKNFLHSEATGEPYYSDQTTLQYDRSAAVQLGVNPTNYQEQLEAEAVIFEGMDILQKNPEMQPWDLGPELSQAVQTGQLTPGQADFIMSVLSNPHHFPTNDSVGYRDFVYS